MFYTERFWKILYTFTCRCFVQIIPVKEENRKKIGILSIVSVLEPKTILSDVYFCLSYQKINYCKITNSIIKTIYLLSDRRHFLIYIYVFKVLFLFFV